MKRRWIIGTVVLFSSLILICGCGKDEKPPQTAQDLINQGWTKFDAGNYAGASADFNAAIGMSADTNDAYLGLGWAELKQNQAGLAEKTFVTYLSKFPDVNDAKAGLAIAYDAQGKFENAIDQANAVLSSNSTWSFSPHDSQINYLDLAYVLAGSYLQIGNYSQSLKMVNDYFDSNFKPDINTDTGRNELAVKIESLYTG